MIITILDGWVAHIPIDFGAHIMNINEVMGSNVKIYKLQFLGNHNWEFLETWYGDIGRSPHTCLNVDLLHIYEKAGPNNFENNINIDWQQGTMKCLHSGNFTRYRIYLCIIPLEPL